MSFFKKLTDTAKSTANTLSSKSQELYTAGRLKIEKTQIEGKIKDKKTELGDSVYRAYISGQEPTGNAVTSVCDEIKGLEEQIAVLDQKIREEQVNEKAAQEGVVPEQGQESPAQGEQVKPEAKSGEGICPRCGASVSAGGKLCPSCGNKM